VGELGGSSRTLEGFSLLKYKRHQVGELGGSSRTLECSEIVIQTHCLEDGQKAPSQNTGDYGSLRSLHFLALHEPKEIWITAETKQPLNKE
jgi:hypothetical protein